VVQENCTETLYSICGRAGHGRRWSPTYSYIFSSHLRSTYRHYLPSLLLDACCAPLPFCACCAGFFFFRVDGDGSGVSSVVLSYLLHYLPLPVANGYAHNTALAGGGGAAGGITAAAWRWRRRAALEA